MDVTSWLGVVVGWIPKDHSDDDDVACSVNLFLMAALCYSGQAEQLLETTRPQSPIML